MFPTVAKTKISSSLAYPANAKLISEALADVPQSQVLTVSFFYWQSTARMHQCAEPYPVMKVMYSYDKASQFTPHHIEAVGLNEPKWEIWVQPVPSIIKHHVKGLLQREALPKMETWLRARRDLTGMQGSHSFTVWYDEAKDELSYGEH